MYKIIAPAFMGLFLMGCQTGSQTSGADWAEGDGCEKYFSETTYDLKACQAYVNEKKQQQVASTVTGTPVTQTLIGTKVDREADIKRFETTETNIDD